MVHMLLMCACDGWPCLQAHDDAHQAKQGLTLQALQSGAVHLCPHPISAIQHF